MALGAANTASVAGPGPWARIFGIGAGLVAVLDPRVVMHTDGGGVGPLARPPIKGAARLNVSE